MKQRGESLKVSVIMPVYNEEKYLEESIGSWLSQTLKEKELICIDDGSTDQSREIIRKFQKKHADIILIEQSQQGAGAARNKGLRAARGEYICFLDADDTYIDHNALKIMYETICKKEKKVCAGFMQINNNGLVEPYYLFRDMIEDHKVTVKNFRSYQQDFHYQCYMFDLTFLKENKIEFPLFLRYQDPPFLLQVLTNAEEVIFLPIEFYLYRVKHREVNYTPKKIRDFCSGIYFNLTYAMEHDLRVIFRRNIERINGGAYSLFYHAIIQGDVEIQNTLRKIQKLEYKENSILDVLLMKDKSEEVALEESNRVEEHCRHVVPINSRIIIYGAGKYGRIVYNCLVQDERYNIVGWADFYKAGTEVNGVVLMDTMDLNKFEFDYILIAIRDIDISEKVRDNLLAQKIRENKIVMW